MRSFFDLLTLLSPQLGFCPRCVSSSYSESCLIRGMSSKAAVQQQTNRIAHPDSISYVTLNVRNAGAMGISFNSYVVKDSAGNRYTKMNWTTPFMNPNQLAAISIVIDGNAFTFQSKNSYTVTLITTRNNQFTFPITA